jgi:hypothetical protein
MLLQVQPTTYYYIDEARNKGNGKVYGFIAQQIKEVIPDAVIITQNIIPNIYKTCLVYNKREIYHSIPLDVAINTEVQIFNKEGGEKGKRYKIKEIYEDHFVIDEDIDGDDCFVFGYSIDDLHGLDKSYIYTLNVCATQELHRRIISQEARILELEAKVEFFAIVNHIREDEKKNQMHRDNRYFYLTKVEFLKRGRSEKEHKLWRASGIHGDMFKHLILEFNYLNRRLNVNVENLDQLLSVCSDNDQINYPYIPQAHLECHAARCACSCHVAVHIHRQQTNGVVIFYVDNRLVLTGL